MATRAHTTGLQAGYRNDQALIDGRYQVLRELGRGASGAVYVAFDRLRRRKLVLKHLWAQADDSSATADETKESFRLLTQLRHPCLPRVLDWGEDSTGRVFYTKELTDGVPADSVAGTLSPEQVATISGLLLGTILALHRAGYCHGDVKPDNLLVTLREDAPPSATLIDFGLIFQSESEQTGIRGTARYIAPELLAGQTRPGPETDLYAVGASIYHLLYGSPPFADAGPTQSVVDSVLIDRIVNEEVPHPPPRWKAKGPAAAALVPLIRDLMSRAPAARNAAAVEAVERLEPWAPDDMAASSAFVGREDELDRLRHWYDAVDSGGDADPTLVIVGNGGVGKRRLLNVFFEPLRSRGVPVLEHDTDGDESDTLLSELARKLLIHSPQWVARSADLLGELSDDLDLTDPASNPHAQRLLDHLAEASSNGTIVISVHAGRPHRTLESVAALANYLAADRAGDSGARLAVLVTVDPELDGSGDLLERLGSSVQTLRLDGLRAPAVSQFLDRNLAEQKIGARLLGQIHDATSGNPGALERVATAIRSARKGKRQIDLALLFGAADRTASLRAQLARLKAGARDIVETLAVVGAPMELEALRSVVDASMVRSGTLEVLRQASLVRRGEGGAWLVASDTVRELVLPGLEGTDRTETIAQRYSAHLEATVAANPGSVPGLHRLIWLDRAHRVDAIVEHGPAIAEELARRKAFDPARRAFKIIIEAARPPGSVRVAAVAALGLLRLDVLREDAQAAEHTGAFLLHALNEDLPAGPPEPPWPELLATLAAPPSDTGDPAVAEALALLTDAARIGGDSAGIAQRAPHAIRRLSEIETPNAWCPLFRALARLLYTGDHRIALREALVSTLARDAASTVEPGDRAELLNLLGVLTERDDLSAAVAHYERCVMVASEERVLPLSALKGLGNLLRTLGGAGEVEVARYYAERWLNEARAAGLVTTHNIHRGLAFVYDQVGRPYQAFQTLEESYRLAVRSGNIDAQRQINISRLNFHARFGLTRQAEALSERCEQDANAERRWMAPVQNVYAHLLTDDRERAAQALEIAKREVDALPAEDFREALISLCEAKIALLDGQATEAIRRAGLAVVKSRNVHIGTNVEALITLIQGELLAGDLDEADSRLVELDTLIQKHHLERERPVALHLQAQLEQERGAHDRASQLFQRAHDRLEEQLAGMPRAYRDGYLKASHLKRIVHDATHLDSSARGHLLDGMKRILGITNNLQRAANQRLVGMLGEVLDQIIDFTAADRGILFRVERLSEANPAGPDSSIIEQDWGSEEREEKWTVEIAYARGFDKKDLDKKRSAASGTVLRRVMENAAPVLSADATEDLRFSQSGSIATLGMRSILAFPLDVDGEPRGIVYLDSPHGQQFSESDKELLTMLGNQLGPMVEMAHQREESHVVNETFPRIIGKSRALVSVLEQARKIAHADIPVLVLGETGTGKELLARGVHEASLRSRRPFVAINCASLPDGLVEGELFGAERGAYTGAHQARPGYFEQANTGTVFLDEIGDLPLSAQAKLLRVLQEGVVRRVGSDRDREVDVRIVAATHWDLEEQVAKGEFRQDLFYRLNVMQLRLPPLRERPDDIPELTQFYFRLFIEQHNINLPPPAPHLIRALQQQPWPGNIRQLRNAMERAMLLCNGAELTLDTLLSAAGEPAPPATPAQPPGWQAPPWGGPPQSWGGPPAQGQPPWQPQATAPAGWAQPAAPPWGQPPQTPWGAPPQGWAPQGWGPQGWGPPPWAWGPPPWAAQGWQGGGQTPGPGTHGPPGWGQPPATTQAPASKDEYQRKQAVYRYQMAMDALGKASGNKKKAAEIMGISRRGFYRILEQARRFPAPPPEIPLED